MRELCTMCIEMHSHNRRCRSKRGARTELVACPSSSLFCFQSHYSNCFLSLLPLSLSLSSSLSFPTFPRFLGIHHPRNLGGKGLIGFRPSRHANDRIPFPWSARCTIIQRESRYACTRYGRKIVFRFSGTIASKGSARPLFWKLFLIERISNGNLAMFYHGRNEINVFRFKRDNLAIR